MRSFGAVACRGLCVALWAAAAIGLALGGCADGEEPFAACAKVSWPAVTTKAHYVSAACGQTGGSGSTARPWNTIGAAAQRAKAGESIAVAAGTYTESVQLPAGVTLVGVATDQVVIQPKSGLGFLVQGGGATTLAQLTVKGATGAAISVSGGAVALHRVRATGTRQLNEAGGSGLQVLDAPTVLVQDSVLDGNDGAGVLAQNCGAVLVIGTNGVKPRGATNADVVDDAFAPTSRIEGNKSTGIAVLTTMTAPATGKASLTLVGTDVRGNYATGVMLRGVHAVIVRSALRETAVPEKGDWGDGLAVVPPIAGTTAQSFVDIDAESMLANNARSGMLLIGDAHATVSGGVCCNGSVGLAVQNGAVAALTQSARIAKNKALNVLINSSGQLFAKGATIAESLAAKWAEPRRGMVSWAADGILVSSQGRVSLDGVQFVDNPRVALLLKGCAAKADGSPDVSITNCTFQNSKYGVALVGQYPADAVQLATAATSANAFEQVQQPAFQSENGHEINDFTP